MLSKKYVSLHFMRKILPICLLALVLANGCEMRPKARKTEPVVVRTVIISSASQPATAHYVGTVEPASRTTVTAPYPGRLTRLYIKVGQKVRKGQPAADISAESVRSAYAIAKASLDQARDGYARVEKAHGAGSVADVKLVEIKTTLAKAEAAERAARKALDDCHIRVPYDGVIAEVNATAGTDLTVVSPVFQLVDLSSPEIHISVPEKEWPALPEGLQMEVEIPALERSLTATLVSKGLTASPISHTYTCILKPVEAQAGLMPGMVCKVTCQNGGSRGIAIPAGALMTDMDGRYVWCVNEGTVYKRHVTPTGYSGDDILVTGGLQDGDELIVEGARKVSTGMHVLTRR